jgi:hypothetical protein
MATKVLQLLTSMQPILVKFVFHLSSMVGRILFSKLGSYLLCLHESNSTCHCNSELRFTGQARHCVSFRSQGHQCGNLMNRSNYIMNRTIILVFLFTVHRPQRTTNRLPFVQSALCKTAKPFTEVCQARTWAIISKTSPSQSSANNTRLRTINSGGTSFDSYTNLTYYLPI